MRKSVRAVLVAFFAIALLPVTTSPSFADSEESAKVIPVFVCKEVQDEDTSDFHRGVFRFKLATDLTRVTLKIRDNECDVAYLEYEVPTLLASEVGSTRRWDISYNLMGTFSDAYNIGDRGVVVHFWEDAAEPYIGMNVTNTDRLYLRRR